MIILRKWKIIEKNELFKYIPQGGKIRHCRQNHNNTSPIKFDSLVVYLISKLLSYGSHVDKVTVIIRAQNA